MYSRYFNLIFFTLSCNALFDDAFNKTQPFDCMEPILKLSNNTRIISNEPSYQVVSKCPGTFHNPELRWKCESPEKYQLTSFVQGKDDKTYRNMDCALCNGIQNWKIWKTSLSCLIPTFRLFQERLENKNYSFTYEERELMRNNCEIIMNQPHNTTVFQCSINVLECSNQSNPDYLKCLFYKQKLYSLLNIWPRFKNPHCARCSGASLSTLSLINFFGSGGNPDKNSLAILFDFSKAQYLFDGKENKKESQNCAKDELYDYQQKRCRNNRLRSESIPTINWTCSLQNETFPNSSAFIIAFDNGSIFVYAHQRMYERKDYYWYKSNITVCGNFTRYFIMKNANLRLYSEVEFYLTVVGCTLSILALLLVLITYSIFNELRTLPGKITMNLALVLLLTQVVFIVVMFEETDGLVCKSLAVILHFLYLSSFCWMTVLGLHVAKTFLYKGKL